MARKALLLTLGVCFLNTAAGVAAHPQIGTLEAVTEPSPI